MIELRHLRYFVAIAEEMNFRRAAERVHIDQTPLSRAVRDLEEELQVHLFIRTPRKMRLTPAGARLLEEVRRLSVRFERAKRAVRSTHALHQVPLRVGIADGIAQPLLVACLNGWRVTVPEIPLEIAEMRARELAAALRNENVDVGFSFGVPDDEVIAQSPAWRYHLMAILPRTHELSGRTLIPLQELMAFPLLSFSDESLPGLHAQMRGIVRKYGHGSPSAGPAHTAGGYVTRIAIGAGVGLIDAGHARTLRCNDVVVLPLVEEERVTTYVLHKRRHIEIGEPVRRFLAHASTFS